jgi:hypothetical protein
MQITSAGEQLKSCCTVSQQFYLFHAWSSYSRNRRHERFTTHSLGPWSEPGGRVIAWSTKLFEGVSPIGDAAKLSYMNVLCRVRLIAPDTGREGSWRTLRKHNRESDTECKSREVYAHSGIRWNEYCDFYARISCRIPVENRHDLF